MIIIAFEGIDGVGKTTQVGLIASFLEQKGTPHFETRELYGTDLRTKLRSVLMSDLDPLEELITISLARKWHWRNVVEPALNEGKLVIIDRFIESTWAYQVGGRGVDPSIVKFMQEKIWNVAEPDLTIYLTGPTHRSTKGDKFEREDVDFFKKVDDFYKSRKQNSWIEIDSNQKPEEISKFICRKIAEKFKLEKI